MNRVKRVDRLKMLKIIKKAGAIILAPIMFSSFSALGVFATAASGAWETVAVEGGNVSSYLPAESPLYQKSVAFFGDSLCYARGEQSTRPSTAGWAGRIGSTYRMEWENYGKSGYALSTTRSTICGVMESARGKEYDYVIIEGGTNDAWDQVPLGAMTEGFVYKAFRQSTFAGALEATLYEAKEDFPNATIGFLIMYRMPNAVWEGEAVTGLQDVSAYVDMAKQILEKWGIPYLNFHSDDHFNENVIQVDSTACLSNDYIHLNSNGYDCLSSYISTWMESLPTMPTGPDCIPPDTRPIYNPWYEDEEKEGELSGNGDAQNGQGLKENEEPDPASTDTEPNDNKDKKERGYVIPVAVTLGTVAVIGPLGGIWLARSIRRKRKK